MPPRTSKNAAEDIEMARLVTPGPDPTEDQIEDNISDNQIQPPDSSCELMRLYTPKECGDPRTQQHDGMQDKMNSNVMDGPTGLTNISEISAKNDDESHAIEELTPYVDEIDDKIFALHDKIQRMRQARTDLEAAEEYIRADNIRLKLVSVFAEDKKMRIARLKRKQELEVSVVEAQFEEEKLELEEAYKTRRRNFEGEVRNMRETLANKQKTELDEYTASLEKKHAEVHPKYSSKLLEMRYTQAQLLRVGRYKEATKKRGEADAQQQIEDEKRSLEAHQNIVRLRKKMQSRQIVETEILENKIKFGRKALNESYQLDKDKLTNRQTNILHEITLRHKHEMVKLKKAPNDSPFSLDETGQDIMATDKSGEALYSAQMANKTILTLDGESILKKYIADEYTVAAGTRTFVPTDTYRQTTIVGDDTTVESQQGCSPNNGDYFDETETHVDDAAVADRTHNAELDLSGPEAQSSGHVSEHDDDFDLAAEMNEQIYEDIQEQGQEQERTDSDNQESQKALSPKDGGRLNDDCDMDRLETPKATASEEEDAYDLNGWEE